MTNQLKHSQSPQLVNLCEIFSEFPTKKVHDNHEDIVFVIQYIYLPCRKNQEMLRFRSAT